MNINDLENLILHLSKIPGIGQKNAKKYAIWLAEHKNITNNLIEALTNLQNNVKICKNCFNLTLNSNYMCDICLDNSRDRTTICVVESIENLVEIEDSNVYKGLYFVLGGLISPIYDIDSTLERIELLKSRTKKENIKEVILVLSSTTEGELTAQYIKDKLSGFNVKITKVANGIPIGANINYIDRKTLIEAFKGRIYV